MPNQRARSERVSPTAYATGHMWVRMGLSHPGLSTRQGRALDRAFGLITGPAKTLSGVSFDALMQARHQGIDALLMQAIDAGEVGQVIEIATGLSGRGLRMCDRYGDKLTYMEADLPHMVAAKRTLLDKAGLRSNQHHLLEIDALTDDGPLSLGSIAANLNPNVGTAVITEGLMNYLDLAAAQGLWQRIATQLQRFPQGLYLADAYLQQASHGLGARVLAQTLSRFVGGHIHIHFNSPAHAMELMRRAGFAASQLYSAQSLSINQALAHSKGAQRVHILQARSRKP